MEEEEKYLTVEVLIVILVLIIYTIAAPIFEKYKFHYIHESGVVMILGVIISFLASFIHPEVSKHLLKAFLYK